MYFTLAHKTSPFGLATLLGLNAYEPALRWGQLDSKDHHPLGSNSVHLLKPLCFPKEPLLCLLPPPSHQLSAAWLYVLGAWIIFIFSHFNHITNPTANLLT